MTDANNPIELAGTPFAQTSFVVGRVMSPLEFGTTPAPWAMATVRCTFWSLNDQLRPMESPVNIPIVFQGSAVVKRIGTIMKMGNWVMFRGSIGDLVILTGKHLGLGILAGQVHPLGRTP